MTSLNGDVMVLRNGRSTSQVSIYNYPEHLNPFYEDDQHKRLRFWKINKNNEGRRNSFSIGNLKDMWSFKSFRLKKKSSTLGINKTSESPPPLRREFQTGQTTDNFNTFDKRSRYSDNVNGNQFDRGVGYRSSLQNMHSGPDRGFGLNRNDQYRRTLQQGDLSTQPRRYVYGGSVTPQPQRHEHIKIGQNHILSNGASRLSVNTNPFDSDDEMEMERNGTRASSLSISKNRKKRRAPAPPVPVHKVSNELPNTSKNSSHQNNELHIEENLEISSLTAEIESFVKTSSCDTTSEKKEAPTSAHDKTNGSISNGVISNGHMPLKIVEVRDTKITKQEPKSNVSETLKVTKESNSSLASTTDQPKQQTVIIKDTVTTVKLPLKDKTTTSKSIEPVAMTTTKTNEVKKEKSPIRVVGPTPHKHEVGHVECIHIHVDGPRTESPHSETNRMTSFGSNQTEVITSKTSFTLTSPPAVRKEFNNSNSTHPINMEDPKPSNSMNHENAARKPPLSIKPEIKTKPSSPHLADIHKPRKNSFSHELTSASPIKPPRLPSEEKELPPPEPSQQPTTATSSNGLQIVETRESVIIEENQTQLRPTTSRALHDEFDALYRMRSSNSNLEWKKSTLAPLEQHVPPEKRKSVKDIIESINRSQRLLKAGATSTDLEHSTAPSNNLNQDQNSRSLEEAQIEIKRMFGEIALAENAAAASNRLSSQQNASRESATQHTEVHGEQQKLENGEVFMKCRVNKEVYDYRESSPTTSNLDWNPLPKPKRSKNLNDN